MGQHRDLELNDGCISVSFEATELKFCQGHFGTMRSTSRGRIEDSRYQDGPQSEGENGKGPDDKRCLPVQEGNQMIDQMCHYSLGKP